MVIINPLLLDFSAKKGMYTYNLLIVQIYLYICIYFSEFLSGFSSGKSPEAAPPALGNSHLPLLFYSDKPNLHTTPKTLLFQKLKLMIFLFIIQKYLKLHDMFNSANQGE